MAVPASKAELLEAIRISHARLMADLADVPEQLAGERTLEGHAKGTWMSVHDLVAYLTGWGELVLKWNVRTDAGEPVDFPETGFGWNELGRLAQKFYADYESVPYDVLLQRYRNVMDDLVSLIEQRSDAELYGAPWYGKYPLGRMIQFNTSSPAANARGRLRKWKRARGLA